MAIRDWPEDERPREKLLARGPAALSDAELLAILLRTGVAGKSAVDLGRELMQRFGGLNRLFAASEAELCDSPGMGPAKYVQFQAILEVAQRVLVEDIKRGDALSSPQAVRDFLRLYFQKHQREAFVAIFLDIQNRVITTEELFAGTLGQTSVHPREIVKRALALNAAAIIFAHNHPSGIAEPSGADRHLTKALQEALKLVDIKVLDHFIVGDGKPFSFSEQGLL
jgi:DNA repair protein RadC